MYILHKFARSALAGTLLIVMAYWHCGRNRLNLGPLSATLLCCYICRPWVKVTSESDPFPDSAPLRWLSFLAEEIFLPTI